MNILYSRGSIIFTDGAARGNPGNGGYAFVCVDQEKDLVYESGGYNHHTTNNEMELLAVHEALKYCTEEKSSLPIHIYTDSKYVYQGVTTWMHGWKKKNWIGTNKTQVLHKELWESVCNLVDTSFSGDVLVMHHIPGHSAIAGNERVDSIATAFADEKDALLYHGDIAHYSRKDLLVIPSDEEMTQLRDRRRASRSSTGNALYYISVVNGVVEKHPTWASCEARVKGTSGARFKKVTFPGQEKEILGGWGIV